MGPQWYTVRLHWTVKVGDTESHEYWRIIDGVEAWNESWAKGIAAKRNPIRPNERMSVTAGEEELARVANKARNQDIAAAEAVFA